MNKEQRKQMIYNYKQIKTIMGVYQIKNTVNNKIYVDGFTNLKNRWFVISTELDDNRHPNDELQKDWLNYGREAFEYSVLEEAKVDNSIDAKWEIKKMKDKWLNALQPYEEKGYNKRQS